jgi:glycine/sarcosine N-methyltransferase
MDMRKIGEYYGRESFDALYCLGNTLVHLEGPEQIGIFLDAAFKLVKPDGVLILQILNYDHIVDDHINELPEIKTEKLRFSRWYEGIDTNSTASDEERLRFVTRLHDFAAALSPEKG